MSLDCRGTVGDRPCTLSIAGSEVDLLPAAVAHAVLVHGDTAGPELTAALRATLAPQSDLAEHGRVATVLYASPDRTSATAFTDDAHVVDTPSGRTLTGGAAIKSFLASWTRAFPDATVEVSRVAPSEGGATVEFTFRGTQTGVLDTVAGRIPPTGSKVVLQICDVVELEGGRVSKLRSYYDEATLLVQLAVVAAPADPRQDRH